MSGVDVESHAPSSLDVQPAHDAPLHEVADARSEQQSLRASAEQRVGHARGSDDAQTMAVEDGVRRQSGESTTCSGETREVGYVEVRYCAATSVGAGSKRRVHMRTDVELRLLRQIQQRDGRQ